MAKCNMDALLDKIGEKKLTKQEEITFSVHSDLPDCRKVNTKNFNSVSGNYSYNRYLRPGNRFECMRTGCANSGTLELAAANETALYFVPYDATEFAAGVLTFYLKPQTQPVTVTVKLSNEETMTNADVYTASYTEADVQDDGFVTVFIDLTQAPASTTGEGWTASASGVWLQISASVIAGISSISFFESIYDFEINDTVKVSCLSEIGGTFDVDALESTCLEAGYDDTISSLEFPVTGNTVTPNYWKLFPMLAKGDTTEGYFPNTAEKTVLAHTNAAYGYVRLPDAYQDECGYWAVQISDECNYTDAYLTQLSVPALTTIDDGHYQIVRNTDGTTDIIVNAALIGKRIKVAYPMAVTVEDEMVANADNLNTTRTRMTVPRTTTDGVRYLLVFDNVLVTSFPTSITTEETSFAFTINIQRNKDGNFFRRQRISTDNVISPSYENGHI